MALKPGGGPVMAPQSQAGLGLDAALLAGCGPPTVCLESAYGPGARPELWLLPTFPSCPLSAELSRALVGPQHECPMCQALSCRRCVSVGQPLSGRHLGFGGEALTS